MNFHPYVLLVSLLLIVITAAGTLVHGKQPAVTPTVATWDSTSVPLGTVYSVATNTTDTNPVGTFKIGDTLPTFTFATNQAVQSAISHITSGSSDTLSNLYSYLGNTHANASGAHSTIDPLTDFKSALSFSSAVSTSSTIAATTPQQNALRAYGNAAGGVVRALEAANANENTDLDAFFKSPSNATAAPVIAIAQHLIDAAAGLRAISTVPQEAQAKNEALASVYADAGTDLAQIAAIRKNEDFGTAITMYEKSVSGLGIAYVALVLFFQEQKVQFTNSEDGSVFTFSGTI